MHQQFFTTKKHPYFYFTVVKLPLFPKSFNKHTMALKTTIIQKHKQLFNKSICKRSLKTIFIAGVYILFLSTKVTAQRLVPDNLYKYKGTPLVLLENKGQITDQYGKPRGDIQFKTGGKGVSVFIGKGKLEYQFCNRDAGCNIKYKDEMQSGLRGKPFKKRAVPDTAGIHYQMYRLDMELLGANQTSEPIAEDLQDYYENYHTTALNTNSKMVNAFAKVTYKNIYPNIDWVLYIKDDKLEYDFIVNPGSNINDIKITYSGATDIAYNNQSININTPMGNIGVKKLYVYDATTHDKIPITYTKEGTTFGLATNMPVKTKYIIDPVLEWGTYFGGEGGEYSYALACEKNGTTYMAGVTTSYDNIATVGAHQTSYKGQWDCFITSFTAQGALRWATYYGGAGQDIGVAVAGDNLGGVFLTGTTGSTEKIATPGSREPTAQLGMEYSFLARFNNTGVLDWGTYIGNGHSDEVRASSCDAVGNIYICGSMFGDSTLATPGCYQDTVGGMGFLEKFSKNGNLLWGTYFGSTGTPTFACACDNKCNIYIGGTVYRNGIIPTPHCYQDSSGGGWDCFVAKFDSTGVLLWDTYFGGDSGENVNAIACDGGNNVYLAGETFSRNGIATPGANQPVYGGAYEDGFLAKFNDTGAMQWATYYGGIYYEEARAVVCDALGHVYIAGFTDSPNNIATPGSLDDEQQLGSWDAFFAKFNDSGHLLWGTYYGGAKNDLAYGLACDSLNCVYMGGGTASISGIATPGCYQFYYYDSGDCFLIKFDTGATGVKNIDNQGIGVVIQPNPSKGVFVITCTQIEIGNSLHVSVCNNFGQLVYDKNIKQIPVITTMAIDLKNEPKGVYFLTIEGQNSTTTKRLILD